MMSNTRRSTVSFVVRQVNKASFSQQPFLYPKQFQQQQRQLFTLISRSIATSSHFAPSRYASSGMSKFSPLPQFKQPYVIQRRHMGIGDFFTSKIENKKNEMQGHKERESFRQLRDFLISCPRFRFKEQLAYVESLQAQVGKTDRLVGGQDVKLQEEMMKKKIQMFKSMTPLELLQESPGAINMGVKSRISLATGLDRKQIEVDLKQFDELKSTHSWLHNRLKQGKTLPENSVEMQKLMNEDPPAPSFHQLKIMQKARQTSRRTRH